MSTELQTLPLNVLKLSQTTAQVERRAHFDKDALAELAESIKSVGMLAPIVARPVTDGPLPGHFQIVAGERRFLAAKKAGLDHVPVSVRELTDEQVLEVQLVENLQREDLHELAEAEGYEALMKLGYTAEQMADKVGKSKATVYARMKLLALCKEGRKAFYDGAISASIALLIARVPDPALQKQALEEIGDHDVGDPMSYRDALEYIHREFTFRLDQAGFPTTDATLVPAAGACSACPKRTGNQPELFADIKRGDVCTDPGCFRQKREAIAARKLAAAKASGQRVIDGKQAASITKYGTHSLQDGFVKLDDKCYDDPKSRTYRQLLSKDATPALLVDPKSGGVIEVAEKKDLAPALKGIRDRSLNPDAAREKRAKLERAFRQQLYTAIRPKLPEKLGRAELEHIALVFFKRLENEVQKQVLKLWNWELATTKRDGYTHTSADVTGEQRVPKLNDAALARFMLDCSYAQELRVFTWSDGKPELLLAAAARLKIDPEKIRKDLAAAAASKAKKPTPAKASKKKAARKAK